MAVSDFTPSLGAVTFRVSSRTVRSPPVLIAFLALAVTFRVPAPERVTTAPSLPLMTAFSASGLSGLSSALFAAVSARVLTVPASATIRTAVSLLQQMGAAPSAVSSRPRSTSVTSLVSFLTLTEPEPDLPLRIYSPLLRTVTAVPSTLTASSSAPCTETVSPSNRMVTVPASPVSAGSPAAGASVFPEAGAAQPASRVSVRRIARGRMNCFIGTISLSFNVQSIIAGILKKN